MMLVIILLDGQGGRGRHLLLLTILSLVLRDAVDEHALDLIQFAR
jgi:hypothetical protein